MVGTLLAHKKSMSQIWTEDGKRIPVTELSVSGNTVVRSLSLKGEDRIQIAFGDKKMKNTVKPQRSLLEKIGVMVGKRKYTETTTSSEVTPGQVIKVEDVLAVGDVVKLTGTSKGKGFAGVMKRHGFHGGPRTHGQSDRERAPGSIGQRTTPGRVFPGMRMAGRMGGDSKTFETAHVVAIDPTRQSIWIQGTVPGSLNSFVTLIPQGKNKPFVLTEASEKILGIVPVVIAPVEEVVAETTQEVQE
jgi:large subunit ribosomal protein L3